MAAGPKPDFLTSLFSMIAAGIFIALSSMAAHAQSEHRIYVLVNDLPITGIDITQRTNLLTQNPTKAFVAKAKAAMKALAKSPRTAARFKARVKAAFEANPPSSREEAKAIVAKIRDKIRGELIAAAKATARRSVAKGMRTTALRRLIEDRLKLAYAKKLNIVVSDDVVLNYVKRQAGRNKMSVEKFKAVLARGGVRYPAYADFIRANMAWSQVLRRAARRRRIDVSWGEINKEISPEAGTKGAKKTEYALQRIILSSKGKLSQAKMLEQFEVADGVRRRFRSCAGVRRLAKGIAGAKYENLGSIGLDAVPAAARPVIQNAKTGQMTPPIFSAKGIELYAVCDKREVRLDSKKVAKTRRSLRRKKMKQLERSLLLDLCSSATIEYKVEIKPRPRCGAGT